MVEKSISRNFQLNFFLLASVFFENTVIYLYILFLNSILQPVKPPKRRGRKAGSKNIQKQRPGGINVIKLTKSANSFDENSADTVPMTDSNSSSPPPSGNQ